MKTIKQTNQLEKINKELKSIASFCNAFWYSLKLKWMILDYFFSWKTYKETLKYIKDVNQKMGKNF